MRLLIDTHAFLWWRRDDPRLGEVEREAIRDGQNDVFLTAASFLFPWAVSLDALGLTGLVALAIFLAVLVVGFIYEWKMGALEWD